MKKILKFILSRKMRFFYLSRLGFYNKVPDDVYIKKEYSLMMNEELNLQKPITFNEKLQWLKLYDRKPIYTTMVDKYEAKKYVGDIIGDEYIIPSIGIYDKFDDINFNELPNQFVIKCTHDSGGIIVCKDKNSFNKKAAKKKINKHLKRKYYYEHREWPYKNVKPRILVEKYMEDKSGELRDYKVYAFNGKAEYVMLCFDRFKSETKFIYFDKNWNMKKEFSNDGLKYGESINVERPTSLNKMFEFAEKLSKGIPFVRVDFYEVNGKLYFGELTFYPSAGFDNTRTKACQEYLDEALQIDI